MLTDTKARQAKPSEKPYKLADDGGLHLFVTPAGGKIWRYRYEREGKENTLVLGRYPEISLADARRARDDARSVRRGGVDPNVAKRDAAAAKAASDANTFELVARAWHAQNVPNWRERHADDVLNSLERDVFPTLGGKPIASITAPMVLECLRAIEARPAIETAHRVRQRMSAVFVYAIASGIGENDPAAIVKPALRQVVKGRQPAVVDLDGVREMLRNAEAIAAHPATRLALRLMALTAVRGGELRGAMPAEFEGLEGQEALWRIPAARMKAGREHLIPLAPQAVDVIRAAISLLPPRAPLLFPSVRHLHQPMSENAIGYLLNRAGYHGHHVPHGFRSAFSTIMNERYPADRSVIDLMLSHAPKDRVESAYNRAERLDRRRELTVIWADTLLAGFDPPETLLGLARR